VRGIVNNTSGEYALARQAGTSDVTAQTVAAYVTPRSAHQTASGAISHVYQILRADMRVTRDGYGQTRTNMDDVTLGARRLQPAGVVYLPCRCATAVANCVPAPARTRWSARHARQRSANTDSSHCARQVWWGTLGVDARLTPSSFWHLSGNPRSQYRRAWREAAFYPDTPRHHSTLLAPPSASAHAHTGGTAFAREDRSSFPHPRLSFPPREAVAAGRAP
jgi:hypothetical protein